ncbi:MAG: cysteine desulfurase [Thermoplasmata archaeon]
MNIARARADFPALRPHPGRPPVAYLDSACMSLVPDSVLRAMEEYYSDYPGCAGRSLHRFAEEVSRRYDAARGAFANFVGTRPSGNIVFLRNATEAINLVASGLDWKKGDRVLVSDQEHNSNLVVWQRLQRERGIRLEILPLSVDGSWDGEVLERALSRKIRLVSLFHTSNLDGRSLPIREIAERAHDRGARTLFDGCQAAPHQSVNFDRVGTDFYAISAHKMLGPTGTGILVGTPEALSGLRPLVVGGETVEWTTLADHRLRPPPYRFEAGLQNYGGIIGAHAGLRYLERVGLETVERTQRALNREVTEALSELGRVHVLGPQNVRDRPSIFGFTIDGIDPHDAALFLDEGWGVLVRSGMHCVHSWYERRGLTGSVRASFYLYNNRRDVAALVQGVRELVQRVPLRTNGAQSKPRRGREAPRGAAAGRKCTSTTRGIRDRSNTSS